MHGEEEEEEEFENVLVFFVFLFLEWAKLSHLFRVQSPLATKFLESNLDVVKYGFFNDRDCSTEYRCSPNTTFAKIFLEKFQMFEGCCMDVFDLLFILIFNNQKQDILQGKSHPRLS